jgi:Tfp pilus assembly protein PilX
MRICSYAAPAPCPRNGRSYFEGARAQLQEAEEIIQSARTKDEEQACQIAELQDTLLEQEQQITGEVADLKQKLTEEKTKLRQSWKTSCEQLTEQDALIAAKDEEMAELKHNQESDSSSTADSESGTTVGHSRRDSSTYQATTIAWSLTSFSVWGKDQTHIQWRHTP